MHKNIIGELINTTNAEYGFLIAIVMDALLLIIIASSNRMKKLNLLSYIIAALLLIPLTFQMSHLIGAMKMSNTESFIDNVVNSVSPSLKEYVSSENGLLTGWFFFRRILWSVLFIGTAGFCIYATMDKRRRRNHSTPGGIQTGRKYTSNKYRKRR